MSTNLYSVYIKRIFDEWKMKNTIDNLRCIPIYNGTHQLIGWLRPIIQNYREAYPGLPILLGKWRRENPSLSASVFAITEENTTYWLDKLIVGRDDRILFLMDTIDGQHIGHLGYSSFNFEEHSAEIDCVLRGIPSPVPKMMTHALKALLKWGKRYLLLKQIYLSTGKTNEQSITLYTRCGFKKLYDIPLYRHELKNEVRWDEDPKRNPKEAEKWAIKMKYEEEI